MPVRQERDARAQCHVRNWVWLFYGMREAAAPAPELLTRHIHAVNGAITRKRHQRALVARYALDSSTL